MRWVALGLLAMLTVCASQSVAAESFTEWVGELKRMALSAGISSSVVHRAFKGVTLQKESLNVENHPEHSVEGFGPYVLRFVTPQRVREGHTLMVKYTPLLKGLYGTYGVDPRILIAIWGMETDYGRYLTFEHTYPMMPILVTRSYSKRRRSLFTKEVLSALRMVQKGVPLERMRGSNEGSFGYVQFLPSTYMRYAVPSKGRQYADIWTSPRDALASAAHYLRALGWKTGRPWLEQVSLGPCFDMSTTGLWHSATVRVWKRRGVKSSLPNDQKVSLVVPAGYKGPAFLVDVHNFHVLYGWNHKSEYVLSVELLANAFQKETSLPPAWAHLDHLVSKRIRHIQTLLLMKGYDPGKVNGLFGASMGKALQAYQVHKGLPADGYPSLEVLRALKGESVSPRVCPS